MLYSYTCMYTKYNYTYKTMFFFVLYPTQERKIGFIEFLFAYLNGVLEGFNDEGTIS